MYSSLIDAYANAFSFRFSNYFILYCSKSLCILNNIKHNKKLTKCENDEQFVYPFKVELPRSMITIVTNWNLPMHYWLKTCNKVTFKHLIRQLTLFVYFKDVFNELKQYGSIKALFSTYVVSALLHVSKIKTNLFSRDELLF